MDVLGFSRGAAAARHFIHQRAFLYESWPGQPASHARPEVIINFVGLYDTVSSFAYQGRNMFSLLGHVVLHGLNTDKIFCDDVRELGLNMGDIPKQVVHLASADEHRQNFSLTNINSSLRAGVGVELRMPGVHSDVGGSYAERDEANPTLDGSYTEPLPAAADNPSRDPRKRQSLRALNLEARRIASTHEQQELVEQGWYLPGQFVREQVPYSEQVAVAYSLGLPEAAMGALPESDSRYSASALMLSEAAAGALPPLQGPLTGVRYLTNEYQYVTLRLLHNFALGQHGGGHAPMELRSFTEANFAIYQVPPALEALARHLEQEAANGCGRTPAEQDDAHYPNGKPPELLAFPLEQTKWLRNRYLHRSAKQDGDFEPLGMEARKADVRLIIPDDNLDYVPPSLRPRHAHPPAPLAAAEPNR